VDCGTLVLDGWPVTLGTVLSPLLTVADVTAHPSRTSIKSFDYQFVVINLHKVFVAKSLLLKYCCYSQNVTDCDSACVGKCTTVGKFIRLVLLVLLMVFLILLSNERVFFVAIITSQCFFRSAVLQVKVLF